MRFARTRAIAAVLTFALTVPTAVAWSYWSASGTGSASATSATFDAATISVPGSAMNSVTVTWTQPASLNPASAENSEITYAVERRLGAGSWVAIATGGCSGTKSYPTTSCADAPGTAGSYTYRAVASFRSWTATSAASGAVVLTVDVTAPAVQSIGRLDSSPTNAGSVQWTVTFDEAVTGVGSADFALAQTGVSGSAVTSVSGSGATYTVTASTGSGDGTLGLNVVDDDSIVDAATNKLGGTGTGNGNLSGQLYTLDRTAPSLSSLQMLDVDADGKIDRVTATFTESLASSTLTAQWTPAGVPSAGTLASVSTSAAVATLTITEGAGAADTAVGSFTVALATNASGIRDAAGNQSSFSATAPTDVAGPVPTQLGDSEGQGILSVNGKLQGDDTLWATFSEAIASGLPGSTPITESNSGGNSLLTITGFTDGALDMGSADYTLLNSTLSFSGAGVRSNANKTVTITAGSCTAGCLNLLGGSGTTMAYRPAPTLLDAAGNAATGSLAAGFKIF